jgi:hypothetical protein
LESGKRNVIIIGRSGNQFPWAGIAHYSHQSYAIAIHKDNRPKLALFLKQILNGRERRIAAFLTQINILR